MSEQSEEAMLTYYKRLFPYGPYFRWLNYGNMKEHYFHNREFSFTLPDDIYIRYQSFKDEAELEEELKKMKPQKIDLGAVYNHRPKNHRSITHFLPMEKELVFDIDMTDYDDVRNCCQGADICDKCWKFMVVAVKVLDVALREDFGYQHLLWVFSGRRGVHCWVCDDAARALDQSARSAVAEYLQIIKGGEQQNKKVSFNQEHLHPAISRAAGIVGQHFESMMVEDQDILGNEEAVKKFLLMIPDEQLRSKLEKTMLDYHNSISRWRVFQELTANTGKTKRQTLHLKEEIMLQLTYPRLDINVSKQLNHLLKSPFCVHPKTGKICVPIDPSNVEDFSPETVPTLSQLINELLELNSESLGKDGKSMKEYERTALNPSIQLFKKFLNNLESSWRHKRIIASDAKMEF
ncbi:DNA primase small subunit-like [Daphnia carinata]|uniref:DNA primase small subunit-like n=1 Tax=Daphnia carinata TaxID=120202 RepID=UPI00257E2F7E|nr:DNA primase small subunit-like [Daphnia carinata]